MYQFENRGHALLSREARYSVLARDTTKHQCHPPKEGGEKQLFFSDAVTHVSAGVGGNTFDAPGPITTVRNNFAAGGP